MLRLSAHLAATLLQVEKENPDLVAALKEHAKNNEIMLALANGIMICKNTTICWWVRASLGLCGCQLVRGAMGGDGRGSIGCGKGDCAEQASGRGKDRGQRGHSKQNKVRELLGAGYGCEEVLAEGTESLDWHRDSRGVRSGEAAGE